MHSDSYSHLSPVSIPPLQNRPLFSNNVIACTAFLKRLKVVSSYNVNPEKCQQAASEEGTLLFKTRKNRNPVETEPVKFCAFVQYVPVSVGVLLKNEPKVDGKRIYPKGTGILQQNHPILACERNQPSADERQSPHKPKRFVTHCHPTNCDTVSLLPLAAPILKDPRRVTISSTLTNLHY